MGTGSHSSKRKKKHSQKRNKKRSKRFREKTKKLKRRHDSVSCSDDGNPASTSSVSHSDSSSEANYRSRRRARSRDRRDTRKASKKKTKRNSSMSDSGVDSHRVKKRKKSKRKRDFDSRKKRHGKRRRREPSSSSSRSHSTSEHSNDSTGELKTKKHKLEEMKERDWDEKGGERIQSRRSRYSSRSCSPCSLRSGSHSFGSEERAMAENLPKRLKSVIVVVREIEEAEVGEANKDEHKDEIVYEHDDYPSRSNDSNDGMSRGEAFPISHDASDDNMMYLEEPNREAESSDVTTSELPGIQRLNVEITGGIASSSVEFGVGNCSRGNRSEVSVADVSSNSVDLEAMLRQKALKNLLKRQGKLPTKIDGGNQGDHHVEVKNPNGGGSFESAQKVGRNDDVRHTSVVSRLQKYSRVDPPIRKLETGHPVEMGNASANPVLSRPKLGVSTPSRRLLGSSNTWRRDPTSQNSPLPNPPTPKETVDRDSANGIESESSDTKMVTEKADRSSAAELPTSGGKSTKDETNEADEDSEFEQKTMTVMRGGELVQVSYKVKIPKKAPALARRQLKRQS